jgi:hypothetical protein
MRQVFTWFLQTLPGSTLALIPMTIDHRDFHCIRVKRRSHGSRFQPSVWAKTSTNTSVELRRQWPRCLVYSLGVRSQRPPKPGVKSNPSICIGIHFSARRHALSKFSMPAMSPTMTEGGIASWKKKEGESFASGEVILEIVSVVLVDVDCVGLPQPTVTSCNRKPTRLP